MPHTALHGSHDGREQWLSDIPPSMRSATLYKHPCGRRATGGGCPGIIVTVAWPVVCDVLLFPHVVVPPPCICCRPAVNKRMAGDLGAIQAMQAGIHEHLNISEPMRYIINCLKTLAELDCCLRLALGSHQLRPAAASANDRGRDPGASVPHGHACSQGRESITEAAARGPSTGCRLGRRWVMAATWEVRGVSSGHCWGPWSIECRVTSDVRQC